MATNWNDYELVLEASDSKECEVTGRNMGGTNTHVCPVSKLKENEQVRWEPSYGGYHAVKVTFLSTDDTAIHLSIDIGFPSEQSLKPGEEWRSGWYSFGSWDYHVALKLQKKTEKQDDQN